MLPASNEVCRKTTTVEESGLRTGSGRSRSRQTVVPYKGYGFAREATHFPATNMVFGHVELMMQGRGSVSSAAFMTLQPLNSSESGAAPVAWTLPSAAESVPDLPATAAA